MPDDLPNRVNRSVKDLLPALRREAGNLSQMEFAILLKWGPGKVARLEVGKQRLDIGELAHLARRLRQDPVRLYVRFVDTPATEDTSTAQITDGVLCDAPPQQCDRRPEGYLPPQPPTHAVTSS
jgi:transcriptional regulator with XRE-family HTH domain